MIQKQRNRIQTSFLIAYLFIAIFAATPALANVPAGKIVTSSGLAEVQTDQVSNWIKASPGLELFAGDRIRTGEDGKVALLLADETLIQLARNTNFQLKNVKADAGWQAQPVTIDPTAKQGSKYGMTKGLAWLLNKHRKPDIQVETPTVTAAIRGTEIRIEVYEDKTSKVGVLEGAVSVFNEFGTVNLTAGEEAVATPGSAPVKQVLLDPYDAVQWTIYIPRLIRSNDFLLLNKSRDALLELANQDTAPIRRAAALRDLRKTNEALELYKLLISEQPNNTDVITGLAWTLVDLNQAQKALELLEKSEFKTPHAITAQAYALITQERYALAHKLIKQGLIQYPDNEDLIALDAWTMLLMGEITQARMLLDEAPVPDNRSSLTKPLSGLVYLLENNKEAALADAKQSVSMHPDNAAGWLVLAYVQQAHFDLDEAEIAARKAISLDEEHVTALLTQARLKFGQGYIEEAAQLVTQASQISPGNSQAQSLLGFIRFAQRDDMGATTAFMRSIEIEPGSPEPHLGLSLTAMREGQEGMALEEISKAVLLDPRRSLYRSYWAKMLYQMERYHKALDVLDIAKNLDDKDPTPHLYRALVLRDLNRPSEAIEAMNTAISLNDYRAVYRSRFLLDQDLAVKNIDLSLIFRQLNLDIWAQAKATDSINQDYTNASAHLFYAGSLTNQDDRSLARNTENLLARLLTSANQNSFNTFNNYTTFLEQPNVEGEVTLTAGSQDTLGAELLLFGSDPDNNLAFQAGYFARETEGWRKTNGEGYDSLVGWLKWDATPEDSFMAVASITNTWEDDKDFPRYEYDAPSEPREGLDGDVMRLEVGYHHNFEPGNDLLLHASMLDTDLDTRTITCLFTTPCTPALHWEYDDFQNIEQPYKQIQGLWIKSLNKHQLLLGSVQYWGDDDSTLDRYLEIVDPINGQLYIPFGRILDNSLDRRSHSYYAHDIWNVSQDIVLEAGLYYDSMELTDSYQGTEWDEDELNPRIGGTYKLSPETSLHLAAFRYLLPFQSDRLEPSSVAGIPVYRNGYPGSETSEIQFMVRHQWQAGHIQAGVFSLERDYEQELALGGKLDHEIDSAGTNIAWNHFFQHGIGHAVEYTYQRMKDTDVLDDKRHEHLFEDKLTWVRDDGLTLGSTLTYRNIDYSGSSPKSDEDFWILDLAISKELTNKRGRATLRLNNVFDEHFNWVTDQFVFTGRVPERELLFDLTVNFD